MIEPIWIENGANSQTVLHWTDSEPLDGAYKVLIDGEVAYTTADTHVVLSGLKPGAQYRIDVIQARPDDGTMTAYATPARGTRLLLTAPEYSDVYAYKFYQDGALLATQYGSNGNAYLTGSLAEGSYQFKVGLVDAVGNETTGSEVTGTVEDYPSPPTDPALVYSAITRKATITATPAGSPAGYLLFSNYLDGSGLTDGLVSIPLAFSTTPSFETFELAAGAWIFAIKAVDTLGLVSTGEALTVNVDTDGSQLDDKPPAPVDWDCYAAAGGTIIVDAETDYSSIKVYQDGVLLDTVAASALPWTSGDLGDDTYDITITNVNGTAESDDSEAITVTTDSTPPAGPATLTIEAVK